MSPSVELPELDPFVEDFQQCPSSRAPAMTLEVN
jgi:hypothetical protein